MEGWIKIHRKVAEKAYYKKDSEKVHLWLHLIIKATHNGREEMFNGSPVSLKPGQLTTGRKQLSIETGIDESKIERILKYFEKTEQQIEQQTSNANRLITILNWNAYQETEQHTEQQSNNNRTTTEQQSNNNRTHYKNVKNDKNDKNDKKKKEIITESEDSDPSSFDKGILTLYTWIETGKLPNTREPVFAEMFLPKNEKQKKQWLVCIDDLIRLDKFSIQQINKAIIWAREDDFWRKNFLSLIKLRKKDKDGVQFIKRFIAGYENPNKGSVNGRNIKRVNALWNEDPVDKMIRECTELSEKEKQTTGTNGEHK